MMRTMLSRITGLFRRSRRDAALDEEVRAHLELLAADYERRGMTPDAARFAARRAFGGVEPMKERYRDRRGVPWVEDLARDVRYALRGLRRNPGFTAVAVLTLALGIGANAGIFSLFDALFLKPLPVPAPRELVRLVDGQRDIFTYPEFQAIRNGTTTLGRVVAVPPTPRIAATSSGTTRRRIEARGMSHSAVLHTVSRDYFDVLRVRAAYGRTFDAQDTSASERVAVISASYWRSQFGGSPSVLGEQVRDGRQALTVVGIAPEGFSGTIVDVPADIWVSLDQAVINPADPTWTRPWMPLMARLRPGATETAARVELTARLGRPVAVERAGTGGATLRESFATPMMLLMGLTALVLLAACANLASLTLARAVERTRESAVRRAIGATRGRLVRQALVESFLLAAIGGAAALVVAQWTSDALLAFLPVDLERARETLSLSFDARLLAFTAAASLASGVLFGLGPAWRGGRIASATAGRTLRTSAASRSTQGALVVSEVAICVLVLTLSGLCVRTLRNLDTLDAGFERDDVLVADVLLPLGRNSTQHLQWLNELRRRLAGLPSVQAVGFSQMGQLSGFGIEGPVTALDAAPAGTPVTAYKLPISDDFLAAIGTPLVAGRDFDGRDRATSTAVAIVNESFVQRVFHGGPAVGRRFREGTAERGVLVEVVGVAKDANWISLRDAPSPLYYRPMVQGPALARPSFVVRGSGDLAPLADALVRTARELDPRVLIENAIPMTDVVDRSLARERLAAQLSALVALLAALIACLGVYGVLSQQVARRTREIGIRSALGADRRTVTAFVLRQGLVPTAIGIAVGLAGAGGATRYIEALLYGITPLDPLTYGLVAGGFALVAALASYLPARRAARVDPIIVLRSE